MDDQTLPRLKFDWRLNFGHVFMVVGFILTASVGEVARYYGTQQQIENLKATTELRLGKHDLQLEMLGHAVEDIRRDVRDNATETRAGISGIRDIVSDIRERIGPMRVPPALSLHPHG